MIFFNWKHKISSRVVRRGECQIATSLPEIARNYHFTYECVYIIYIYIYIYYIIIIYNWQILHTYIE